MSWGTMSAQRAPRSKQGEACSTILVVEDEVLLRMVITDQLRDAGYSVIEAVNAHEATEVLRNSANIEVVISDIQMPGSMDGVDLARMIRSEYPAIKIVLASGHLALVNWADHDGFFEKPYDADKIIRHIKALLA
jgi:two-component system, response regulator PdtaR